MKETELYAPIKLHFETLGYGVNAEVNRCDMVMTKDEELIIVELKVNMSVVLLAQACNRQNKADYVYVAIPRPLKFSMRDKWRYIIAMLKRLNIGLIFVDFRNPKIRVELVLEPKSGDKSVKVVKRKKLREKIINESNSRSLDLNVGGSVRTEILTSYREKSLFIAYCLERFGELSTKQLKNLGSDVKMTYPILYSNHYGWFKRVEKGVYILENSGKDGVNKYPDLIEIFMGRVNHILSDEKEQK